jgi:hypothetical protein
MAEQLALGMVTLLVDDDLDAAIAHYTTDIGFHVEQDVMLGPSRRWIVLVPFAGAPPQACRISLARASSDAQRAAVGAQAGNRVAFFLHTSDFSASYERISQRIAAAAAAAAAAGGDGADSKFAFMEAPRHESYGSVVVLRDKYGNLWDLIQPRRAEAAQ